MNVHLKSGFSLSLSFYLPGFLHAPLLSCTELVLGDSEPGVLAQLTPESSAPRESVVGYFFMCVLLVMFYLASHEQPRCPDKLCRSG